MKISTGVYEFGPFRLEIHEQRLLLRSKAFDLGAPRHGLKAADLEAEGTIYQVGVPPNRVDIISVGLTSTNERPQDLLDADLLEFVPRGSR